MSQGLLDARDDDAVKSFEHVDPLIPYFRSAYITTASLSFIGSLSVLFTGYMFPSMVRQKRFSQLIMLISANNLIAATAGIFGWPTNPTLCAIQAVVLAIGSRGSWVLMIFLCFELRNVMETGQLKFTWMQMFLVYTIFQLVSAFLPLASSEVYGYGLPPQILGLMTCTLNCNLKLLGLLVWSFFDSYTIFVVAVLTYNVVLIFRSARELRASLAPGEVKKIEDLKWSASLYPVMMLVVWAPIVLILLAMIVYVSIRRKYMAPVQIMLSTYVSVVWGMLDGFFNGVIFFYNGLEARRRWTEQLEKYGLGRFYLAIWYRVKIYLQCIASALSGCCASIDQESGRGLRGSGSISGDTNKSGSTRRSSFWRPDETAAITMSMRSSLGSAWGPKIVNLDSEDWETDSRMSQTFSEISASYRNTDISRGSAGTDLRLSRGSTFRNTETSHGSTATGIRVSDFASPPTDRISDASPPEEKRQSLVAIDEIAVNPIQEKQLTAHQKMVGHNDL